MTRRRAFSQIGTREANCLFRSTLWCLAIVGILALTSPLHAQKRGGGGGSGGSGGGSTLADPTNLQIVDLGASELTITWSSSGGNTAGFIVAYEKDGTPRKKCTSGTQINVGNAESLTITGLDFDSYYGIRVCAYDASGARTNGITVADLTLPLVSMSQVLDLSEGMDVPARIIVQNDGKFLVSGRADLTPVIARFNSDGSLDTSFSGDGISEIATGFMLAKGLTRLSTGKYIVTAKDSVDASTAFVHRFDENGNLESSIDLALGAFDTVGANMVFELANGQLLIVGHVLIADFRSVFLARLNSDPSGLSIDEEFGTVLHVYPDSTSVYDAVLQPDGFVVVAGVSGDFGYAARYDSIDGSEDYLRIDVDIDHRWYGVALDSQGAAYFGGRSDPMNGGQCEVMKLDANGNRDSSWANGGLFQLNYSILDDSSPLLILDSQDRLYLVGETDTFDSSQDYFVARLRTNGTLDTGWAAGGIYQFDGFGGTHDGVWSVAIDNQDRLYFTGESTPFPSLDSFWVIYRFNR